MRPAKAPPFQIRKITPENQWLNLLIYGMHGCGKTTLAGSAADVVSMRDVLMISAEGGNLTLLDNDRVRNLDMIDEIPVNDFDSVVRIYEYLSSHVKFRDADNMDKLRQQQAWLWGVDPADIDDDNVRKYRTVIIDSLTEVEAYCMAKLLGTHGEFSAAMLDEDIKTAEFKEYKQNNDMVNKLVRAFRDLPLNVIVLAGRAYEQDELKKFLYFPQLTGKLRTQVQGYFDIVGYLMAGKVNPDTGQAPRRLYVQPEGRWDAKCRFAGYKSGHFDDPTLASMLEALGRKK